MNVYSYAEAREQLSVLLEKASIEGQVKLLNHDGQVFIISPAYSKEASPFDVPNIDVSISKAEIIDAIRESRAR